MEPRARAGRHKFGLNFGEDLKSLLYGTGAPVHPDITHPLPDGSSTDYLRKLPTQNKQNPPTPYTSSSTTSSNPSEPFPETLRVLDEILTDYIIETCHSAATIANYAGRTKLKYSDFEWGFRRDRRKLGRVQELFRKKKMLDRDRKMAEMDGQGAGAGGRLQVREMMDLGDVVGEEGTGRGKGRGRGRRRKRGIDEVDADDLAMAGALAGAGIDFENSGPGGAEEDLGDVDVDVDNDLEELGEEDISAAIGDAGMSGEVNGISGVSSGGGGGGAGSGPKRKKAKATND